jgi:NAD(P)-dependent dehydrogenase (short-subunit alcohol dehydrogenase family)
VHQPANLIGRNALVLGANDPVGAAIALAFAKAGADVAVTSSSGDPEEAFALRPLRRAIEAEGRRAIADIADLGNGSSVQIAVRQIAKQLGRIDIGVIVSSEALDKPIERVTDAEWSHAIGFNLGAYFYAARALAREFAANEPVDGIKGRIVALLPALDPQTASPIQLAARAGAEALIEALAREWHTAGIRLTSIAPSSEMPEAGAVAAGLSFAADH